MHEGELRHSLSNCEQQERLTQSELAMLKRRGIKDLHKGESLSHFILRHRKELIRWVL